MLTLPGSSALSAFRIARLLARLQRVDADVGQLQAQFLYFVDLERALEPHQQALLTRLLDDGGAPAVTATTLARSVELPLLVVPRPRHDLAVVE